MVGGSGSLWAVLIGSGLQLLVVGDSGWVGGHVRFAVGGGWVVILAVNFIFLHLLCPMLLDSVTDLTPPPMR